jgi:hypothetical protein
MDGHRLDYCTRRLDHCHFCIRPLGRPSASAVHTDEVWRKSR